MSGKEQFQKIKKETFYISKDGKFYDEKKIVVITEWRIPTRGEMERIYQLMEMLVDYTILKLEEATPTPDQYFLKKGRWGKQYKYTSYSIGCNIYRIHERP